MSKSNNIRKLDDFLEEEIQQDVKTEKGVHLRNSHIRTIPNGWKVMRLKDILTDIYYGITAKAVEKNTGLRMLRTTDIKDYRVNWDKLPYCEITGRRNNIDKYLLKKNDLIVARAGTAGVSVLVEKNFNDVIFGSYLIKIRLRDGVCPKFVHYFFQSKLYWRYIAHAQAGSTLKNINLPTLKSLRLLLPPIDEQRKIVEILSTVDEAIRLVDESIARTERLKRGLMQELLTKGIGHKEFKQTEIGKIPKEWKVVQIKDIADVKEGIYGKREGKGIIQLKADSIQENGRINKNKYALIAVPKKRIKKYLLRPGDIILSNRNSEEMIGKVAIYYGEFDECVFSNLLTRIRVCSEEILPEWLLYILMLKRYNGILKALSTRAVNQVLLKKETVEKIRIPIPPLPEQKKIVNVLSLCDRRLELNILRREKLEKIKSGLMNTLLTGKARIEVKI